MMDLSSQLRRTVAGSSKVQGSKIGPGSERVIRVNHSRGRYAQFPFPAKGLHAPEVSDALYLSCCSMLRLDPSNKALFWNPEE